jgi:hypothetical protein
LRQFRAAAQAHVGVAVFPRIMAGVLELMTFERAGESCEVALIGRLCRMLHALEVFLLELT